MTGNLIYFSNKKYGCFSNTNIELFLKTCLSNSFNSGLNLKQTITLFYLNCSPICFNSGLNLKQNITYYVFSKYFTDITPHCHQLNDRYNNKAEFFKRKCCFCLRSNTIYQH